MQSNEGGSSFSTGTSGSSSKVPSSTSPCRWSALHPPLGHAPASARSLEPRRSSHARLGGGGPKCLVSPVRRKSESSV